ncbi:neuronal growth regulator 1-like [Rhodnius prolixus]
MMKYSTQLSYFIVIISVLAANKSGTGASTSTVFTTIKAREHDTVFLPCYAGNLGSNSVQWWHQDKLITDAGQILANEYYRIHLNNTLEVTDITDRLSGVYFCQVKRPEPMAPIKYNYIIQVLYPPKVWIAAFHRGFDEGVRPAILFHCNATGFPQPFISWTIKGVEIPELNNNSTFLIYNSKDAAGEYACTASNGVGKSDTKSIITHILYPPSVSADKIWIHTSPGLRTVIECNVDGDPSPEVEWLMNNKSLVKDSRISYFKNGNTHGIVIKASRTSDIGTYTCKASNHLGEVELHIELSALPNIAQFKSIQNKSEDRVTLVWEVESYSPIVQYHLLFRQQQFNSNPSNWTKLTIPSEDSNGAPIHTQSYTLIALEKASFYEACIISKNIFGWSKPSNIYRFCTPGVNEKVLEREDEVVTTEEGTESNTITDFLSDYVTDYENEIYEIRISQGERLIMFPSHFLLILMSVVIRLKLE